jgi:hypothetical protein
MKTVILIEYFDLETELFIGEIDISKYDLKKINQICTPWMKDDLEYCCGNEIKKDEFAKLQEYIGELKSMDFDKYGYDIITRQIM